MSRGKNICNELKKVRRRIAEENDIPLEIRECTYKGECSGTCPRCEAEVQYLERELEKRLRLGKVATVAGLALGLAACSHNGTPGQDPNDMWEGEDTMALHDEDSADVPPMPEEELPDWYVPELEGIVHQDDGYRMVPTKDTMERLKDTDIDWDRLYDPNVREWWEKVSGCDPLEEPKVIMRGECGTVYSTGHVWRRRISKILVPHTPMESFKGDEERENRKALPNIVEYDEVDGKKVVKQQNPAEQ